MCERVECRRRCSLIRRRGNDGGWTCVGGASSLMGRICVSKAGVGGCQDVLIDAMMGISDNCPVVIELTGREKKKT